MAFEKASFNVLSGESSFLIRISVVPNLEPLKQPGLGFSTENLTSLIRHNNNIVINKYNKPGINLKRAPRAQ